MSARNMGKRAAAGTLALAVCLSGGAIALAGAANAAPGFKFDNRAAGDNRYLTAIEASKKVFKDGTSPDVIIVNGEKSVDGLTASALAGAYDASILYAEGDGKSLRKETQDELKRLGAKKIWLVGGETVLSASLKTALSVDYQVERVSGANRFETSAAVAKAAAVKVGGVDTVFVASGENNKLVDSVTVASVAYDKSYPILLTKVDGTDKSVTDELATLKSKGVKNVIAIGGTNSISDSTAKNLGASQPFKGENRAATAALVRDEANKTWGFDKANAALVGDENQNIGDSLVSSPWLASLKTTPLFAGQAITTKYLTDHAAELTGKGVIIGGTFAVSAADVTAAEAAAGTAVASSAVIVTNVDNKATGSFTFADVTQGKGVAASFGTTDSFMVGGTSATIATFRAALTVGDTVEIVKDSPEKGKTTYKLVQKDESDYQSGLVGGTLSASSLQVVEPITGQPLATVTTTGSYTLYTVDGSNVSLALFNGALSVGDTVKVTGGGTGPSDIRTIALTNNTVKGKVTAIDGSNFKIQGSAGAAVGPVHAAANGDTLSVDGVTKDQAGFNAALSAGDSVSYSMNGGVQTIALTNAAPSLAAGQVAGAATVTAGELTSLPIVPDGLSAATAAPLTVGVLAGVTTEGTSSGTPAAEVQTLTFASAPYGKVKFLFFKYAGSAGVAGMNNQIIKVAVPNTGNASADATTLASNIEAAVHASGTANSGGTVVTSATVAATSSTVMTITYSGNTAMNNIAAATSITPLEITVDGSVATVDEAVAALSVGDAVKYQAGDVQTRTTARLEITTALYSGVVKPSSVVTSGTVAVQVYAAGSSSAVLGDAPVKWDTATAADTAGNNALTTGTTAYYSVNGSTAVTTSDAFKAALDSIKQGVLKGSLEISQSGTKTVYSLKTTNA